MKNLQRFSFLLFLLLARTASLPAQKETLLIGPGDAGTVPFNFLGSVKVAGLTPEQAAAEIDRQLVSAGVMRHPQVTVRVEAYATQY
jgi:hypothetical protein